MFTTPIRGRGAAENPPNRFEPIVRVPLPDYDPSEDPSPKTLFFKDHSHSILTKNDSPDIPVDFHLNPYRGCEHGCIYCFARPTHEYLSFSAGLDFEMKILVKEDAPELLRKHFLSEKWQPQTIAMSGVTDCYQPIERRLKITRRCLEVFAEFRNPVGIVTKSALVARDADVLAELAKFNAALVYVSVTTLDPELARLMEPRAAAPAARLRAIEALRAAGVPVGVMVGPVIPGLTDHEAPAILRATANAGAINAAHVVLRLPFAVKELFQTWLDQHFPEKAAKVLDRIREIRDGKLNDTRWGKRMRPDGVWAEAFRNLFRVTKERLGMNGSVKLTAEHFRRPGAQLTLF
jgi:DNA repair photolyase